MTMLQILGLGAASGKRTMAGPSLVARHLQPDQLEGSPLRWLATPVGATLLSLAAAGELAGDKIPGIPSRLRPMLLIPRVIAGAVTGAMLSKAAGRNGLGGPLLGAAAAVAGAFSGSYARRYLTVERGLPDPLVAFAEDALTYGVGSALLRD